MGGGWGGKGGGMLPVPETMRGMVCVMVGPRLYGLLPSGTWAGCQGKLQVPMFKHAHWRPSTRHNTTQEGERHEKPHQESAEEMEECEAVFADF